MRAVQDKLDNALRESKNVLIRDIFTEKMLDELVGMHGGSKTAYTALSSRSVHHFLTDPQIGHKRFVSMPDRVMREVHPRGKRPSIITGYSEPFSSISEWWGKYMHFMQMVDPLKTVLREYPVAKYGAWTVTQQEMRFYKEYQLVHIAAADAALAYLGLQVPEVFGALEHMNVHFARKYTIISEILHGYDADIVCLQEMDTHEQRGMNLTGYQVFERPDSSGKQESTILLKNGVFEAIEVINHNVGGVGDLTLIRARHVATSRILRIGSYHGDTNGLSTRPTLEAILELGDEPLILGSDTNAHSRPSSGKLSFEDFKSFAHANHLHISNADGSITTQSARTYFQAQSHKGNHSDNVEFSTDPKDNIIVGQEFEIQSSGVDFSGSKHHEPRLIPNELFPSDHAIVWAELAFTTRNEDL